MDHTPNVDVRYDVEVVGGGGDGRLEFIDLQNRRSGEVETVNAAAVFVLIGAKPFTDWLPDDIERDRWGYVLTGAQCGTGDECDTGG